MSRPCDKRTSHANALRRGARAAPRAGRGRWLGFALGVLTSGLTVGCASLEPYAAAPAGASEAAEPSFLGKLRPTGDGGLFSITPEGRNVERNLGYR